MGAIKGIQNMEWGAIKGTGAPWGLSREQRMGAIRNLNSAPCRAAALMGLLRAEVPAARRRHSDLQETQIPRERFENLEGRGRVPAHPSFVNTAREIEAEARVT